LSDALAAVVRSQGARLRAALAARFRDLDLAEESVAEAVARAAAAWPREGSPREPAAWLHRVATRVALDAIRHRRTAARLAPDPPPPAPTAEDALTDDAATIPEERLRLILVCCHPAVAPDARAALTLKVVCGLSTARIARGFLLPEPTLAQRLVRAKRKIAEAGIRFEIPAPEHWPERLGAILSTLELAYAAAHEDAAGAGPHAGFATEALDLTALLAALLPHEVEVHALAALVRFAEARRPARLDPDGAMVPLSEQDPARWDAAMIAEAQRFLAHALSLAPPSPRVVQAAIHGLWCARRNLEEPPAWPAVLALYDALLAGRDDPVVRINRAVAVMELHGAAAALAEIACLDQARLDAFAPWHALRAEIFRRLGQVEAARASYAALLALDLAPAERLWLTRRAQGLI